MHIRLRYSWSWISLVIKYSENKLKNDMEFEWSSVGGEGIGCMEGCQAVIFGNIY